MKMQRLIIFGIILFFSLLANGQQIKKFTHDPEKYPDELSDFFARSETNYQQGKELLEKFLVPWKFGDISENRKNQIYDISDMLLNKRARNYPHFYDYISVLLAFYEKHVDSLQYENWQNGLLYLLKNPKSKLSDIGNYLQSTNNLLEYNALYYSPSAKWFANHSNYSIEFDGSEVKVIFDTLTLTCIVRNDSMNIFKTSGAFLMYQNIWKGNKAFISWEKTGLRNDSTYAEVDLYSIQLAKSEYSMDSVRLYHKEYFQEPILGKLTDKVVEIRNIDALSYPKFSSYEKKFEIENIFDKINYSGGFAMSGNKFIGSGDREHPAKLSLYREIEVVKDNETYFEDVLFMEVKGYYFALRKNSIRGRNAKASIYVDTDSISHPGLTFRFSRQGKEVNLIRDEDPESMYRSPFYDSYHKMDLNFEQLTWQMDKKTVNLAMLTGASINIATFESDNFFNSSRYYEVQGLEDIHPFISLRRYAYKNGEQFYDEDLSKFMRLPLTPVKTMLIDFTYKGIVDYDSETGFCKIKPRLYEYLDNYVGKRDYDLIQFESRTSSKVSNAVLNLQNMDLEIAGVPMVNVSDSQNVIFYPKDQKILVKRNRNFDFGGIIEAGLFTYYGQDFQFKYDSFKVVLNKVDSLSLKVKSGTDAWGRRTLANVESVIENITGDLVIDDPGNKSGVKDFPQYPIFESKQYSYVYYDSKDIQKGKYTRDRFFFKVAPYVIDSLNDFSVEGMGYEGEFHSSDIFPVMDERLTLQPDNSLGFKHFTTNKGLPAYKGKGNYYDTINLSNDGLIGSGTLDYLASVTSSKRFIFFPDSTNAKTRSFYLAKTTTVQQYPEVKAEKVYMHWMPYADNMTTQTLDTPMIMYQEKAKHWGSLVLSPEKLEGKGVIKYYDAGLTSDLIAFKSEVFNSEKASFYINSINPEKFALNTSNVEARVSFVEMKSRFKSLEGTGLIDLPENRYHAHVEKFVWDMDDKDVELQTPNTVQVYEGGRSKIVSREEAGLSTKGSLFVSMHPEQDSLQFSSPLTNFDLKTNTIYAHQVKYVSTADASVYPHEGEVTVEENARMKTLQHARLLANTKTRFHDFHEATINISSRKKYHGEGRYYYKDELEKQQEIYFDMIAVDTNLETYAKGKIKGIQDFSLSPAFKYQGNVKLYAANEFLQFEGFTKINHECSECEESWLKFESEINPRSIYIPVDEVPKDINDKFLISGSMMATDSIHVFPSFVSPRKLYSNKAVATAIGFLHFDSREKRYEISSKERIVNKDLTDDYLSLHKNFCNLFSDGAIDLGQELGQVKVNVVGNSNYDIPKKTLKLETVMLLNFFMPEETFKVIGDTLKSLTGMRPADLTRKNYTRGIRRILGEKEADKLLKEQSVFGSIKKLPDTLMATFVFSNLNLEWNPVTRVWQSVGPFEIANIKGIQVNKAVNGHMEIEKRRSGDSFTLYLEVTPTHWYFFNYKRGLMQAYSSEAKFNDIITAIKGSDRKMKIGKGETSYVFFLSNLKKRNDFLKKIKNQENTEEEDDADDTKEYEDIE